MEPVILVSSGVAIFILMIVGLIVLIVLYINKKSQGSQLERGVTQLDKSVTATTATVEDDKNPDVVPHNSGEVDFCFYFI